MPTFRDVFLFRKLRYLPTAICFWYLIVYLLAVLGTMVLDRVYERYVSVDPTGFQATVSFPPASLGILTDVFKWLMYPTDFLSTVFALGVGRVLLPRYRMGPVLVVSVALLVFCFNLGSFAVANLFTRRGSRPTPQAPDH